MQSRQVGPAMLHTMDGCRGKHKEWFFHNNKKTTNHPFAWCLWGFAGKAQTSNPCRVNTFSLFANEEADAGL